MRSHAKASSAGSNLARGASRRSLRRPGSLAALLVALLAAACALPGSAFAVEARTLTESFGPDGTSGTSFEAYGLGPLAFDQGNDRLYALDQAAHQIHGFDASTPGTHTPLGGSFPLSEPTASYYDDIAVDSSSGDIYLANNSGDKVFGYDENGAPLPGFPLTGFNYACGITVDSVGNVWVADANEGSISQYSPTGELLHPYFRDWEPCRIAIDDQENLFVTDYFGATKKWTAIDGYLSTPTVVDPEISYALTRDHSTGELYVVHFESISVYDEAGTFLYEFGAGSEYYGEFGGIAIDETTEEVYVHDYEHGKIRVFGPPASLPKTTTEGADGIAATEATVHGTINPRGQAVEDCHFEVIPAKQFIETKYENVAAAQKYPCVPAAGSIPVDANPHAVSANATGLNPATTYHYRLAAKNSIGEGAGFDRQFTTGPASPLVEEQSVEVVGTTEATVAAKINPRGGETTYRVEYGTSAAYGQSTTESAPFGFPSDNGKHPVSVHVGGLSPGTAYHFRFVATNPVDTTEGTDTSFATYPATNPTFAPCPNDDFRVGAGSRLPDCRAYEQGTPVDKHGANAQVKEGSAVSASGDRFTFLSNGGLPVSGGLSDLVSFLASRGPDGWSTDGFLPLTQATGGEANIIGVNEDLSTALVQSEAPGGAGRQLFLRDSEMGTFQPTGPVVSESFFPALVGFADDPSHLVFLSNTQLLPSALENKLNLYDLDHGALTLAGRIPAGSATGCDDEAGPACVVPPEGTSFSGNRISRDGRVFFTAHPTKQEPVAGRIYMREDGARTTWISASQRTTPDPGGEKPAQLVSITPDGSKAFFLSCEKLTDDSTAVSTGANSCTSGFTPVEGQDLYSYDVESGELTDLTVDSNAGDPLGAAVKDVLGVSEDGSYVYFFAYGVLASGASSGQCDASINGDKCNLYVYHDGVTKFIAQMDWGGTGAYQSRVSADGSALLFSSRKSLTGYNSFSSACAGFNKACFEFFRYSAPEEELLCVSCVPTGISPTGAPSLGSNGLALGDVVKNGPSRNLSADGNRFFFESPDALVPGDTNSVGDVYEWEAKGTGSCESESQNGGCLYLISSGTDPEESIFLGASKSGDHVFFFTSQQLVPGDQDFLRDVYDAGVGAGLASQHTLAPPTCSTTACQANPAPPADQTPASATFQGPGNAHSRAKARKCPKGKRKVRSGGKVRCLKAAKQHKRHNNRGGSK